MTLPGPNQTGATDRRPRLLPSQVLAHMARPRIRKPSELIAEILIDPQARDEGFADGKAGKPWSRQPGDGPELPADLLSYAAGYVAGLQSSRSKG